MVQVGRSVVVSSWKKVGICGVVGVWENIRMHLSIHSLMS